MTTQSSAPRRATLNRRTFLAGAAAATAATTLAHSSRASADTTAPSISYVTESVDDGASMVVIGDNFTPDTELYLFRPQADDPADVKATFGHASSWPAIPPSGAVKATILGQVDEHSLTAGQIGYPNTSVNTQVRPTVLWVKTASGYSAPYLLNRPELYFCEFDRVLPGELVRLFGRNFETQTEAPASSYNYPIAMQDQQTRRVYWAQNLQDGSEEQANVRAYVLEIQVPSNLPPGRYSVYAHTLYGGANGWSNMLQIDVVDHLTFVAAAARRDAPTLPGGRTNPLPQPAARATPHLDTTGYADNAHQLQQQIDYVATHGGGIVALPPGTIALGTTVHVKPGVVLVGSGRGATRLTSAGALTGGFPTQILFPSPSWISGFAGD